MKNLCFFVLFLAGMFSFNTANAQKANNNSDETWVINYYGATTVVLAGQQGVPVNVGTNCNQGISVRNQGFPSCGNIFASPGTWTATCTTQTGSVLFDAAVGNSTFLCPGVTIYTFPEFVFTRP